MSACLLSILPCVFGSAQRGRVCPSNFTPLSKISIPNPLFSQTLSDTLPWSVRLKEFRLSYRSKEQQRASQAHCPAVDETISRRQFVTAELLLPTSAFHSSTNSAQQDFGWGKAKSLFSLFRVPNSLWNSRHCWLSQAWLLPPPYCLQHALKKNWAREQAPSQSSLCTESSGYRCLWKEEIKHTYFLVLKWHPCL